MAERRMFHTSVVSSDQFMDLPVGAQALYFHLGMQADDDGFVNGPKQVARRLRRPPREIQSLIDSNFLLDFDGIVVLRHWLVSNTLKSDRMKPLAYPQIAKQLYITDNRAYTLQPQEDLETLFDVRSRKLESKRNPKVREDKVSKEKIREDKIIEGSVAEGDFPDADTRDLKRISGKLGQGVVFLTDEQIGDLLDKLGLEGFDYYVSKLADFILKRHATVTNHYATILKWWDEDKGVIS